MAHFETTLDSEEIFKGRVFRVTRDTVRLEDGRTSTREIVHHSGGAAVAALTEDHRLYLVRQFRYAFGRELWELPAGKLEPGEDPLEAAKRELGEEVGLAADRYLDLGPFYPTVGYCGEIIYTWAALGLRQTGQHLDEGEFLTPACLPLQKALEMVQSGEIVDGKTVAAVLKLELMRREGKL